jgi:xanthine dehydrogenase accessory factor
MVPMFDRFLTKAAELLAKGEPFVTASVVRFQAPISGKPGDKAIIFADGKMWGWIGGGCAQPVVIKEALKALADGKPRLVRISPDAAPEDGIVDYTMTCHSGGTLDIYIEPVLPRPHILIFGRSPIAQTLARLGKTVGYRITVIAPGADREQFPDVDTLQTESNLNGLTITRDTFIVVSTQGEDDEGSLEQAARTTAAYVAFVASKVKAQKVLEYLREAGVPSERVGQIHAPAGLDIRAKSPEEIAVSILAEIIQRRGNRTKAVTEPDKIVQPSSNLPVLKSGVSHLPASDQPVSQQRISNTSRDPVCGMQVDVGRAKYKSEHHGSLVYFCCAGCKQAFDRQPEKYALAASS